MRSINLVTITTNRTNGGKTAVVAEGASGAKLLLGESVAIGGKRAKFEVLRTPNAKRLLARFERQEAERVTLIDFILKSMGAGLSDIDKSAIDGREIIEVEFDSGYRMWEVTADWQEDYDSWKESVFS